MTAIVLFMHRNKQNVRHKIGALGDNAGNIISHGFLMAECLNGYIRSIFTREDISSLPVPDANFQDATYLDNCNSRNGS